MKTILASLVLLLCAACTGVPGTCLQGGKSYRPGDTFPSTDGCNTCSCLAEGGIACTERACALEDGGADVVSCAGGSPSFPIFDKTCGGAADCDVALHQINCCGTQKAIGIRRADRTRFDKDEAVCRGQYPGCGCAEMPTVAEDGKASADTSDIAVDCRAGACTTYIR